MSDLIFTVNVNAWKYGYVEYFNAQKNEYSLIKPVELFNTVALNLSDINLE